MGGIFTTEDKVIQLETVWGELRPPARLSPAKPRSNPVRATPEIWLHVICWTMACVGTFFLGAGVIGVAKSGSRLSLILIPLLWATLGLFVGMAEGGLSSLLVAAIYNSVPYAVGIDTAAGIGVGQGLLMVYFHLGRGDFVHR